jgi:hypothetical protein
MQLAQKALDETPSYFVRDAKQKDWSLFPTCMHSQHQNTSSVVSN